MAWAHYQPSLYSSPSIDPRSLLLIRIKSTTLRVLNNYLNMINFSQALHILLLAITVAGFSPQCLLDGSHKILIERSLLPFKEGISKDVYEYARSKFGFLCQVKIRNNKLFDSDCLEEGHRCFLRDIVKFLPDMDFLHNPDDRPLVFKNKC